VIGGGPSLPALAGLTLRALSSLPGSPAEHVGDRSQRVLVPRAIDRGLDVVGTITSRSPRTHQTLRMLTAGLADHVALRTDAIDSALRAAITHGATQLVILGAGLDARAYRMRELTSLAVLEVDMASTQAVKRRWARGLCPTCRAHSFVEVDFARDALDVRLLAEGFDASAPTVWIWEGVTPYLARDAIEDTLAVVARLSSPGSRLLMTYATREMVKAPPVLLAPVLAAFSLLGEPLIGRLEPEELAALARREGLAVESDTGSPDWARAHYRARPSRWVITERLAVLTR